MNINITPDEIISTLKRSSLPTVVVEGGDDIILYRRLEKIYSEYNISVLSAGGRDNIINVFNRINEIKNTIIIFIADKDLWVMDGIPLNYSSSPMMIFTDGYSIENDVIRDMNVEDMLYKEEVEIFKREVNDFIRWYSYAIARNNYGCIVEYKVHPNQVFNQNLHMMNEIDVSLQENILHSEYHKFITNDYKKNLRGKSLMGLYTRIFSKPGRKTSHNDRSIMELAGAQRGHYIDKIFRDVGELLVKYNPKNKK